MEVIAESTFPGASFAKNPDVGNPKTLIAADGNTIVNLFRIEGETSTAQGRQRLKRVIGVYSNSHHSVEANLASFQPSGTSELFCRGVIHDRFMAIQNSTAPSLLGFSFETLERFSTIVSRASAKLSVKPSSQFGTKGFELEAIVPLRGHFIFYFSASPDLRLLGLESKWRGDIEMEQWEGTIIRGKKPPANWKGPSYEYSKNVNLKFGPITYDAKGKPVKVLIDSTFEENSKPTVGLTACEILSYRLLSVELPQDRVVFPGIELPSRIDVKMFRTAVPHELRDGRLVAVLDGLAIEAGKTGFRKSSPWRGRMIYGAVVLALIGAFYFWIRRS
jgi:hypothetical protein